MQIRDFRRFRQNGPFWQGTKTRFTKNTVCATLKMHTQKCFLSRMCNRIVVVTWQEIISKTVLDCTQRPVIHILSIYVFWPSAFSKFSPFSTFLRSRLPQTPIFRVKKERTAVSAFSTFCLEFVVFFVAFVACVEHSSCVLVF